MKRIIITGATGLIGSAIAEKLIGRGDEVVVFSRSPEKAKKIIPNAFDYVRWNYDEQGDWQNVLGSADAVLHLAGESVMGARWSEEYKRKILESRAEGTKSLVDAIGLSKNKPNVFVCASGIDYYDDSVDKEVDEDSPAGTDFLSQVCVRWEEEAEKVESFGVRRVSVRTGIVLDKQEGALAKMIMPFKFFIGGPLGSGKQWMPWIHIEDIARLYIYSIDNVISGPLNGVTANPVRMEKFAKVLGKIMRRPSFFKVPKIILRLVVGEGAKVVLKGSKVIPKKTIETGFEFKFPDFEIALRDILNK